MRSLSESVESYLSTARGVDRRRVAHFVAPSEFLVRTVVCMGIPSSKVTALCMSVVSRKRRVWTACAGHTRDLARGSCGSSGTDLKTNGYVCWRQALAPPSALTAGSTGAPFVNPSTLLPFLCVPSLWYENCPGVVLEAMIAGLPMVASDLGGLPELLEGGQAGTR